MRAPFEVEAVTALLRQLKLATRVLELQPLKPDSGTGAGAKVSGYGKPVRVIAEDDRGQRKSFVLHTASANEFGHDRRADRADELFLSYDTYRLIPGQVEALDVGFLCGGRFASARSGEEPYLLTTWADGQPYAEDLRRIVNERRLTTLDLERCRALATGLAELHSHRLGAPGIYRRSIRDLLGHGEGIFGIVDSYPDDTPGAGPARLRAIERRCLEWRWRLRGHESRLARIHGDFHPFNILFGKGAGFSLVDASRGCAGDPADDVSALVINYPFFAADDRAAWRELSQLWRLFWETYLGHSGDRQLFEVIAPFLAWRGLVVANPKFYPGLSAAGRDLLLGLVERILDSPRLALDAVEEALR